MLPRVPTERLVAERQRRARFFDATLFGEPAWDILLDLAKCEASGRMVSVTSACIGSGAPPTTALRWLNRLQQIGLMSRIPDPTDHRRCWVELSLEGRDKMARYLVAVGRGE